jgi:hypothetical protein
MGVGVTIVFAVFIVALSLMGQVLTSVQLSSATNDYYSANITNETHAGNATLDHAMQAFGRYSGNIDNNTEIVRNTSRVFTRITNYNLTPTGVFTWVPSATVYGNETFNITYNYTGFTYQTDFNVTAAGISGFGSIGNLIPTMGLVFGIILVLGVLIALLAYFGNDILTGRR